jgi:hypothetical protein
VFVHHATCLDVAGQVFEKIVEMIPIVEGHLWPQGVSAILCGFANVRFYNEPILDRLSAKILADCNTYSMQVNLLRQTEDTYLSLSPSPH